MSDGSLPCLRRRSGADAHCRDVPKGQAPPGPGVTAIGASSVTAPSAFDREAENVIGTLTRSR